MKTMEQPVLPGVRPRLTEVRGPEPAHQAYLMLHAAYALLPIIAGADKFARLLVDWDQYLAPLVTRVTGVAATAFMKGVGVVEIVAGLLVAVKPRWGAFVVGLWLLGIVVNLLLIPGYFDIALRDVGLSVGAFSLWQLSAQYGQRAS